MAEAYLVIGQEPTESWPLVPTDGKFNANVVSWSVFEDKETAKAKLEELQANDEFETEWTMLGRRIE